MRENISRLELFLCIWFICCNKLVLGCYQAFKTGDDDEEDEVAVVTAKAAAVTVSDTPNPKAAAAAPETVSGLSRVYDVLSDTLPEHYAVPFARKSHL